MTLTNVQPRQLQLNDKSLKELALAYVGKYATTRARLRAYLSRKLRERGWSGDRPPNLEELTSRFAELGLVDDAAYALASSRALLARGYGKRRLAEKLQRDGVEDEDRRAADALAEEESVVAAVRFAMRRRLGPYAAASPDHAQRQKWIAAMVRAGHGFGLARAIASLEPGSEFDIEALKDQQ